MTPLKVLTLLSKSLSGEIQSKTLYKIPLRNLVGRSIERPLKSPLVPKAITPPTSISVGIAAIPVTHSLSLSRMEIKEIASRTRRELLGNGSQLFVFPIGNHTSWFCLWVVLTNNVLKRNSPQGFVNKLRAAVPRNTMQFTPPSPIYILWCGKLPQSWLRGKGCLQIVSNLILF